MGPFKILEKVGHLAYKLDLLSTMQINPVVSIAALEPHPGNDPYDRPRPDNPPAVENADDEYPAYEIERLLKKRKAGKGIEYLIKWKGYDYSWNSWYAQEQLSDARELVMEFEMRAVAEATPPQPTRGRGQGRPRGRPPGHGRSRAHARK